MKKFLVILFLSILCLIPKTVKAQEVHIYLFYGDTCPICEKERSYLNTVRANYSEVQIHELETYQDENNRNKMLQVKEMYNIQGGGVPLTIVGDTAIYGYSEASNEKIENLIVKYQTEPYEDRVGNLLAANEPEATPEEIVENTIEEKEEEPPKEEQEEEKKEEKSKPNIELLIFLACILSSAGIGMAIAIIMAVKNIPKNS